MNTVYNLASGTLAVKGSLMALRMRGLNRASVAYLLISRSEISKQQKFNSKL